MRNIIFKFDILSLMKHAELESVVKVNFIRERFDIRPIRVCDSLMKRADLESVVRER